MNENKARSRLDQRRAPIYEALERFRQMRVVPFDVPGHKRGRGNPELTAFLGQQCVGVDVNSMKPVSYTHLDVYKRQVLFSVSMGTVGFALGAGFVGLGMVMFEGLDDPQDKK